jgi:two-component system CheB/CheR fusion protein
MTAAPQLQAPILVVDDNADAAESLAIVLEYEGYRVMTAHGGQQALAIAEQARPAAVLLDLSLPDIDGFEVARRLRQRESASSGRLLLVAISGHGSPEDVEACNAAGFDVHFLKPVPPDSVVDLLGKRLSGKPPGEPPPA